MGGHEALLTACLVARLIVVTGLRRRPSGTGISTGQPRVATFLLLAVVMAAGAAGWVIEPPVTGEEALTLV